MVSFNLKRVLLTNKKNNNNGGDDFGRFKPGGGGCKKHPKHRQSPGVCSLCLNDRLLQLSSCSSSRVSGGGGSSVSSLSSYYSSSSASSCASPVRHVQFPLTSEGKRSSTLSIFLLSSGNKHSNNNGLIKSRSMAVDDHHRGSSKKSGFWSKLFSSKSKRINTMVDRSSSMRETVTVAS
ncbi:hypothetical protein PIB30_004821 [Stylosanthes scabra]|uniref:Uncharacterized protein n=1 Tax=Stylosanthes scabra TaxID=79078 RepID=A0ABU6U392_9FABA|nr:hypothetical protein [Stylosanthes scabra]